MSSLKETNLVLEAAQLPADFRGTPQQLFAAMVRRCSIKSPTGTNFFVVGDVEPSTDQGPWLKNGDKWYVYSTESGGYVPLNIDDSAASLFTVGDAEPDAPTGTDATVWLRTSAGRVIGWYFWNGSIWRPGGNVPPSGTTAERPSIPKDLEQYFDTDISALIHWERGAWRTVSGTPGDVKFVTGTVLETVLAQNPGWEYLAEVNSSHRGTVLGIASSDAGDTPETVYATDSGISARKAGDRVGAETHTLASNEIEQHTHLVGAMSALVDNNAYFFRIDDNATLAAPTPRPPNYGYVRGDGTSDGTATGDWTVDGILPDGTPLVTSKQLSRTNAPAYTGVAVAHNNMQPTLFLWALTKL